MLHMKNFVTTNNSIYILLIQNFQNTINLDQIGEINNAKQYRNLKVQK